MAGTMVRRDYTLEDGALCSTLIPQWQATAQGATASTVTNSCPKNIHFRKRYYVITASGEERSMRIMDPGLTGWTAAYGAGLEVLLTGEAAPTANNATWSGRTGGRDKRSA